MTVAVTVLMVSLLPSLPMVISSGDSATPLVCECGCGNPKGRCCCAAPSASELALGCSGREDPNDPVDGASGGKIIGPPEPITLLQPQPTVADLGDLEFGFAGPGPRPETPPPQA